MEGGAVSSQVQHLYGSIRRDAVRTDPNESFYAQRKQEAGSLSQVIMSEDNIEKLINITATYTLEHEDVSYTQGMTDLLSPILYVMEREDDAYICFAAMLQRLSNNFGMWCEGTLKKVERLRHLCAVLDPQLYSYLSGIEEDAFALFFGMVLIECRREFSFSDSFHLMEVLWAANLCMQQREDPNWSPPSPLVSNTSQHIQARSSMSPEIDHTPSLSEWASFMSTHSRDVIRQVFGEVQTYSAEPLHRSESLRTFSRNPSLLSRSPPASPRKTQSVTPVVVGHTRQPHQRKRESNCLKAGATITEELPIPQRTEQLPNDTHFVNLSPGGGRSADTISPNMSSTERSGEWTQVEVEVSVHPAVTEAPNTSASELKERSQSDPVSLHAGVNSTPVQGGLKKEGSEGKVGEDESGERTLMVKTKAFSGSHSESELCNSLSSLQSPPKAIVKSAHTEMSDMSSISSANTSNSNSRGQLLASYRSESSRNSSQGRGEESDLLGPGKRRERRKVSSCEGDGGLEEKVDGKGEGGLEEAADGKGEGEGGGEEEEGEEGAKTMEGEGVGDDGKREGVGKETRRERGGEDKQVREVEEVRSKSSTFSLEYQVPPEQEGHSDTTSYYSMAEDSANVAGVTNSGHDSVEEGGSDMEERSVLDLSAVHDSLHSNQFQLATPIARPSQSPDQTIRHVSPIATEDSPFSAMEGRGSIVRKTSVTPVSVHADCSTAVSPMVPFFDMMDDLTAAVSPTEGEQDTSALNTVISNLLSIEQSAPAVTRESSLAISFSDSFPLFVCLSIIMQYRFQIIRKNLDFVGLSILLNTQAGVQNLNLTLRIAHQLYKTYQQYQRMCFGPRFSVYEVWLDNMGPMFERPREEGRGRGGEGEGEEERTVG